MRGEIAASQRGSKSPNMGAEKSKPLEAGAQTRRQYDIERTLGACCGGLLSVYVLDCVIVNCVASTRYAQLPV